MSYQILGDYLPIFVNYDQDNAYYLLPLHNFAYNNLVICAHNKSPFFIHYSYHCQTQSPK